VAGAVRNEVWKLAQTGHLETWQGFAERGKRNAPEREVFWRSILKEVEQRRAFVAGERVLDIGCGLDSVLDYTPDVKRYTLDSLMAELRPLGLSPEIEHSAGLFEQMPFADASFDRVFLLNVLDHVRDPRAGLAEIARVLRPGGLLLLSVDVYAGRRFWIKRGRKFWDRVRGARTKHPWVFSAPHVEALLAQLGLRPQAGVHIPGTKDRRYFFSAERIAS